MPENLIKNVRASSLYADICINQNKCLPLLDFNMRMSKIDFLGSKVSDFS